MRRSMRPSLRSPTSTCRRKCAPTTSRSAISRPGRCPIWTARDQMAKQTREFASGEYLEYLFDGARATQAQREKVLTDMARYTGLPKSFIDSLDLRFPLGQFSTEL